MTLRRSLVRALCLVAAMTAVTLATTERVTGSGVSTALRATRLDATLQELVARGSDVPQRVIIRVQPGKRAALRQSLIAHGDQVLFDHPSIDAITAVVHGLDLGPLADGDQTLSIAADAIVRPTGLLGNLTSGLTSLTSSLLNTVVNVILPGGGDTSGPAVPPSVLRNTLGVGDSRWTGRGVGIAVIDSGLEMSAEFQGRVTAFYDMTDGRTVATSPFDDYGHGTHVAGAIGGSGALSRSYDYRGLAPNVRLIVLKALDKTGAGYTSDVIRAIDFAVENRARFGIAMINLSLGHPIAQPAGADPLVQAVERASRAGLIVVVAAGNQGVNPATGQPGYAGITSPGNAPSAITVGAARTDDTVIRSDDRIPDYSSAGPTWYDAMVKPDVVAPGHNIVAVAAKRSAIYKAYPQLLAADPDYIRLSGTSMATAVTSGSIALLLEANRSAYPDNPPLTANAVKAILQYTAVGIHNDLGLEYDPLRKGAGALNTKGAIDFARSVNTSAPVGAPWLTSSPFPWTSIGGETLTWNQGVIWGSAVIWGSTVTFNETAWGQAVIWGSSNVAWGNAVIWGSSLVWTDSQTWGNAVIWGSDAIGYTDGNAVIWGSTSGLTASSTAWKDVGGTSTGSTATFVSPQ
jgi:serine protease AprX